MNYTINTYTDRGRNEIAINIDCVNDVELMTIYKATTQYMRNLDSQDFTVDLSDVNIEDDDADAEDLRLEQRKIIESTGGRIEAVKALRHVYSVGLKEALNMLKAYEAEYGIYEGN